MRAARFALGRVSQTHSRPPFPPLGSRKIHTLEPKSCSTLRVRSSLFSQRDQNLRTRPIAIEQVLLKRPYNSRI